MAKKPKTKTAAEEATAVADAYHDLCQAMAGIPGGPRALQRLDEAIDRAAGDGVETLVAEAYGLMLTNAAKMLARAQYAASRHFAPWDASIKPPQAPGPLPRPLAEEWLPRIERIQNQIMRIAESGGKVMHVLNIAKDSGDAAQRRGRLRVVANADEAADGDGTAKSKATG